jgi:hypothetical protein
MSRAACPPGPLDEALFNLRRLGLFYRWSIDDIRAWEAVCPCCRQWPLRLREPYRDGPVSLDCRGGGCEDGAIRWAFTADPLQWRVEDLETQLADALMLAEQARDVAGRALELMNARATVDEPLLAVAA